MKLKTFLVLLFSGCSLWAASSAQAASLLVDSPASGQLWTAGSTQNITWTSGSLSSPVYINQQPAKVFITLNPVSSCASSSSCGAGALVPYVIAENIPNTGSYEWTVPVTLPEIYPGPVTVEVGLADSSAEGTSGQFNIIPSNPYLSSSPIISPNGGESWVIGSAKIISWPTASSTAPAAPAVNLLLVPACDSASCSASGISTTTVYTIASNIPNTGSYSWNINTDTAGNIIPPGQYLLSVVNPDGNSLIGSSAGLFNLTASPSLPVSGSAVASATTPVITQLSASSGFIGMMLTISGLGFTQSGNAVQFGPNTYINNLSSPDGMTLQFAVPGQIQGCAPAAGNACNSFPSLITPGAYGVSVINSNGTSNSLPFNLTATSPALSTAAANPPAPLPNFSQGELVMFSGNPTVYLVQNGWLVPFSGAQVFMARGYNWVSVQTVPSVLFNSRDVAPDPVTVPDGSLIKSPDNPTVYLVVGGQKSGIPSISVLDSLGLNLNKLIILSDKEIAGYAYASNQE